MVPTSPFYSRGLPVNCRRWLGDSFAEHEYGDKAVQPNEGKADATYPEYKPRGIWKSSRQPIESEQHDSTERCRPEATFC